MSTDQRQPGAASTSLWGRRLELTGNVTMIVATVLASIYLAQRILDRPQQPIRQSVYERGERLPEKLPVDLRMTQRAVLIVVNSRCNICTASMPFYRKLAQLRASGTKLVVVGTEAEEALHKYVVDNGLPSDGIVRVPKGLLKTGATPLVLLVDGERKVLESWLGGLTDSEENDVLRKLGG